MITYRWIDGPTASDEDWAAIEGVLKSHRWMALNRATSRILIAEEEGVLVGFNILQLIPYIGPLYVNPRYRAGEAVTLLTNKMESFLVDSKARGWIVVAENRHSEIICEQHGMERVDHPLYVKVGMQETAEV